MSSPKFERVKRENPGLSQLFDKLSEYIRAQIGRGQKYIVPKLAAAALGLTDGEAFVLLDLLARGDALRRVYNVYCRQNGALLKTVESFEDLDKITRCDFCNADHDQSAFKVEVAFRPNTGGLSDVAA